MTLDDIIQALEANGWGGKDFLTGDTVIETAQLDEDINGGGGLTLSWKSDTGGVIPAGSTLLGYVMIEPYVPSLNEDGTFQWQPKFSEPAALLGKNYYSKDLVMRRVESYLADGSSYDGVVVAVVGTYSDLDDDGYEDGDLAIALDQRTLCAFAGGAWEDDSGPIPNIGDTYVDESTGYRWTWTVSGWVEGDIEVTSIYSHVFAGPVRTIVENMNIFIKAKMGNEWNIVLHDIDNTLANTNILCTFDGTTIKGALEEVANKAGEVYVGAGTVNLYYTGKTIHLGISNAYSADNYYNRFIVLGGTRNMAKRIPQGTGYAAITQRMHIESGKYRKVGDEWERVPDDYTPAEGETVVTIGDGSIIDMRGSHRDSIVPMERFLVWDDIYPKLNLKVASVMARLCYLLDDNGAKIPASDTPGETNYKLYCKWYITLNTDASTQYFLDTRYIIQDRPLSVLFQSGPLTGREFEVVYYDHDYTVPEKDEDDKDNGHTPSRGEFRIILISEGDVLLPTLPATYDNGGMCPNVGDWVTLVNVAIEDVFKERAQLELLKKGYAMAKLISSGKQASWNETRTAPDVITGETGDAPALGDSVGDVDDGYVVTGIETNLVTGEKQYSWGTFKPHGLLASQIDKIGSLSLSGGEATFAPLVSAVNVGEAGQVIYVGNDYTPNGDGASQATSGKGSSQSATTAIRQAGGNVNMRQVNTKIEMVEAEIEGAGGDGVFAKFLRLLYEHRETLGASKWSSASLVYSSVEPGSYDYWCNGTALRYGSVVVSTDSAIFEPVYNLVTQDGETTRTTTVTYSDSQPQSPSEYDMLLWEWTFDSLVTGIEGKLFDGSEWVVLFESTVALAENLGDAINLAVVGSTNGTVTGSGLLCSANMLTLFSKVEDGTSLAEELASAVFNMGILYHVYDTNTLRWRDVYYKSSEGKWYYSDNDTEYTGDESDITPYSFAKMSADMIEFNGKTIVLAANETMTFHSTYGSGIDSLVIDGVGKVLLADTSISNAAVNGVLTVEDSRIFLKSFSATPSHPISPYTGLVVRSPQSSSDDIYNHHVIELGMKEFSVSGVKSSNSFLNLLSFKNDWSTSLGYIKMKCGDGNGSGFDDRASEIAMGVSDAENSGSDKDAVRIMANRSQDNSQYNYIAVRGRFAIIDSSGEIYGISQTFTADGHTITVRGGIITNIT